MNQVKNTGAGQIEYQEYFSRFAYKLCTAHFKTKHIIDFFEISESMFDEWCKAYPDFAAAIKVGKLQAIKTAIDFRNNPQSREPERMTTEEIRMISRALEEEY